MVRDLYLLRGFGMFEMLRFSNEILIRTAKPKIQKEFSNEYERELRASDFKGKADKAPTSHVFVRLSSEVRNARGSQQTVLPRKYI